VKTGRSNFLMPLLISLAAIAVVRCGQKTNPVAAVTPTPTASPTSGPAPTPTDCQLPHDGNPGCIPFCSFGHGTGDGVDCPLHGKFDQRLFDAVTKAVLDTEGEHPELISREGDLVHLSLDNRLPFFRVVIHKLQAMPGICAADDGLEIAIKDTNEYSEQYKFWTTPPGQSSLGNIRLDVTMHTATCTPAWF
jgi:hypothetical protein